MISKMRIILFIMILLLSMKLMPVEAHTFDNQEKLYDYSMTLTDEEKIDLKQKINNYIKENNIDMVVVLVRHYSFSKLSEYSKEFYLKNNFGLGINNDGIILTIDVRDGSINIETNGALKLYNEVEISEITNLVNKEHKYYDKISTFIDYSSKYAEDDLVLSNNQTDIILKRVLYSFIISIVVSSLYTLPLVLKLKSKKIKEVKFDCIDDFSINVESDNMIGTNTKLNN